jgi:hypothetical protein
MRKISVDGWTDGADEDVALAGFESSSFQPVSFYLSVGTTDRI